MIRKTIDKTFLKFIVVGVINTAFGTSIMFGLYNVLHCNYWISSMANYVFGSILSYYLNKKYTFKNKEKGVKPMIRFGINIIICYMISYGVAKPFVRYILKEETYTLQENGALFVGMCLFIMLNYVGQRFFAFSEKKGCEYEGEYKA